MPAKAIGTRVTVIVAVAVLVTPSYVYFPVTPKYLETWTGAMVKTPEDEMVSPDVLVVLHDVVPPVMAAPVLEYALRVHETVSPGATDDEDNETFTEPKVTTTLIVAVAVLVTPPYVYFPVTVTFLETWVGAIVTTPEEEMVSPAVLDMLHDVLPPVMATPVLEYALRVHETVAPGATDDEDGEIVTESKARTLIVAVAVPVLPSYVYLPVTVISLETCVGAIVTTPEDEMVSPAVLDMLHDVVPPVRVAPVVEYARRLHDTVPPGATDDEDCEMTTFPTYT